MRRFSFRYSINLHSFRWAYRRNWNIRKKCYYDNSNLTFLMLISYSMNIIDILKLLDSYNWMDVGLTLIPKYIGHQEKRTYALLRLAMRYLATAEEALMHYCVNALNLSNVWSIQNYKVFEGLRTIFAHPLLQSIYVWFKKPKYTT